MIHHSSFHHISNRQYHFINEFMKVISMSFNHKHIFFIDALINITFTRRAISRVILFISHFLNFVKHDFWSFSRSSSLYLNRISFFSRVNISRFLDLSMFHHKLNITYRHLIIDFFSLLVFSLRHFSQLNRLLSLIRSRCFVSNLSVHLVLFAIDTIASSRFLWKSIVFLFLAQMSSTIIIVTNRLIHRCMIHHRFSQFRLLSRFEFLLFRLCAISRHVSLSLTVIAFARELFLIVVMMIKFFSLDIDIVDLHILCFVSKFLILHMITLDLDSLFIESSSSLLVQIVVNSYRHIYYFSWRRETIFSRHLLLHVLLQFLMISWCERVVVSSHVCIDRSKSRRIRRRRLDLT